MKNQEKNTKDYYSIDILHIVKSLWQRAWLIVLACIVAGGIGFSISAFLIAPTYSSSVKLYVNNSSISVGNMDFTISSSELSAAQGLVKTYGQILDSRTTYEKVIEKAKVDYTWRELAGMVNYGQSNGTEIMRVTVTCEDPYEASKIANTIAEVLPVRIAEIIDGASMEIVDTAIPELAKVGPSITKYTAVGIVLGFVFIVGLLTVFILLDDTIHDEDYVLRTYDYPILGKVPNLVSGGGKSYSYYYQKKNHKKPDQEGG